MSLEQASEKTREFAGLLKSGLEPKIELERLKKEREAQEKADAEKGSIQQLIESYVSKMKADGKCTYADVQRRLEKTFTPLSHQQQKRMKSPPQT